MKAIGIGQQQLRRHQLGLFLQQPGERNDDRIGIAAFDLDLGHQHDRLGKIRCQIQRPGQALHAFHHVASGQISRGQFVMHLCHLRINPGHPLQFRRGLGHFNLRQLQPGIEQHRVEIILILRQHLAEQHPTFVEFFFAGGNFRRHHQGWNIIGRLLDDFIQKLPASRDVAGPDFELHILHPARRPDGRGLRRRLETRRRRFQIILRPAQGAQRRIHGAGFGIQSLRPPEGGFRVREIVFPEKKIAHGHLQRRLIAAADQGLQPLARRFNLLRLERGFRQQQRRLVILRLVVEHIIGRVPRLLKFPERRVDEPQFQAQIQVVRRHRTALAKKKHGALQAAFVVVNHAEPPVGPGIGRIVPQHVQVFDFRPVKLAGVIKFIGARQVINFFGLRRAARPRRRQQNQGGQ